METVSSILQSFTLIMKAVGFGTVVSVGELTVKKNELKLTDSFI